MQLTQWLNGNTRSGIRTKMADNDLIRRQDALNIAGRLIVKGESFAQYNQGVNNYFAEIAGLPSARPETKSGWKIKGDWLECGACHRTMHMSVILGAYAISPNFCPSCGADMREKGMIEILNDWRANQPDENDNLIRRGGVLDALGYI